MANEKRLTTGPIPALIKRLAIPASVGFFFNTMYNVVDTYFGGLISTEALAALSLSFPVFFIIISMGTGVSNGATALIATAVGAEDDETAKKLAAQGLSFGLMLGVVLTVVGFWASPHLFRLLGASDAYLATAMDYMSTIFCGTILFMTVYMLNAILNAIGDTRTFRNFLIVAFFLNVGLDPWFIYGGLFVPEMGFSGIALATILVQFIGCFFLGYKVLKTEMFTLRDLKSLIPDPAVYKDIARQGFPAALNFATIGIGIFVITYFISRFGKEGVAAYGAAMRIEQIVLLPSIGLNVACLTLVAQNHGAGFYDRIYETMNKALKYGAAIMAVGAVAVFFLGGLIMNLFTDDPRVISAGATYLKIDALVLYAYVVLFVHVAALQGVKRPMFAIFIGVFRQIVAPGIVFWLLSQVFGWELLGIWWGIFIVTWSAAVITVFYTRRLLRRVLV